MSMDAQGQVQWPTWTVPNDVLAFLLSEPPHAQKWGRPGRRSATAEPAGPPVLPDLRVDQGYTRRFPVFIDSHNKTTAVKVPYPYA